LGLGISLKVERNPQDRTKHVVLKVKGMDPIVVDRFKFSCVGKKAVMRRDLVFTFEKSIVSKSWKCRIKKELCFFQEVFDLFPGVQEVVKIGEKESVLFCEWSTHS
jgi:hypothetical protein